MEVPIHRVLIKRDEHIDLVAHVEDRPVAGANGQESMAAANDRLVSVVSIEMQPAPGKDKRCDVASGGYPLAVLAANANCEVDFIHYAEPVGAVRGVNLLRWRRISKRRIVESYAPAGVSTMCARPRDCRRPAGLRLSVGDRRR